MPPTCIFVTVLLAMIACTAQVVFASSHQERNALEYELNDNVMRWAKSQGAFIHDAVEIRHIEGGLSGLFASKPIPEGQVLSLVPLNLTIFSDDMNGQEDDGDYAEYSYHEEMCILLHNVYASLAKNETIQNPYEKYLASRSHDHLPITWSVEAKEMLQQLDGPSHHYGFTKYALNIKSQIRSWCEDFDESWEFDYESHMDDPKFLDAAYLAITRSEGAINIALVPFMDLVNHSNGYSWNVDANHVLDEKFEFVASRQIDEGEQLYYTYHKCKYCSCFELKNCGTPDLFSTYGFLEHYPQRWVFEGVDLAFDVNDNAGNLSASFVDPPTKTDILFLKKELKRLELFGRIKLRRRAQVLVDSVEDMSELELDSITKFHGALVKACKVALDAAQSLKRDVYTNDASTMQKWGSALLFNLKLYEAVLDASGGSHLYAS